MAQVTYTQTRYLSSGTGDFIEAERDAEALWPDSEDRASLWVAVRVEREDVSVCILAGMPLYRVTVQRTVYVQMPGLA